MKKEDKPYIINGERLSRDEYNNLKFDSFLVRVYKGRKEIIQAHATEQGESLNAFINRAVNEAIEREKQKASE